MSFSFLGKIPASKSLMNRALIVKSFYPDLRILGASNCDDVHKMHEAITTIQSEGTDIDCGHAGTVLRFLASRVARLTGSFKLSGSRRLFERPQEPLVAMLNQLGADVDLQADKILIRSQGWKLMGDGLHLNSSKSSQFASGVVLSAWDLEFPLFISIPAHLKSRSYLQMTVDFVSSLGMTVNLSEKEIFIPAKQKLNMPAVIIEPDMSSVFAVAAMAALKGEAIFLDFPEKSLQPDAKFIDILRAMGANVIESAAHLKVTKANKLLPIEVDLSNYPDLFPVLSVICAFAQGESYLYGVEHLKYKESNRVAKTVELLEKMGVMVSQSEEGVKINGTAALANSVSFDFDPDEDHRMAMAAGIAEQMGVPVNVLHQQVVSKSFPEFFQIIAVGCQ